MGERLEELKQKHEQVLLVSIEFLKALLDLARDVVAAEQAAEPIADEERGKAAATHASLASGAPPRPCFGSRSVGAGSCHVHGIVIPEHACSFWRRGQWVTSTPAAIAVQREPRHMRDQWS